MESKARSGGELRWWVRGESLRGVCSYGVIGRRSRMIYRGIEENRHAQKNYETVRKGLTEPYE